MLHAPEGYVDADVEFHNLLARSAHNSVFLMMIEPIAHLLLASRRRLAPWRATPGGLEGARGDPLEFVQACC
jgi:DNA-binding FadR family transcriptional regulator